MYRYIFYTYRTLSKKSSSMVITKISVVTASGLFFIVKIKKAGFCLFRRNAGFSPWPLAIAVRFAAGIIGSDKVVVIFNNVAE